MKLLFRGALIASLLATPALANEPSTDLEKLSYSLSCVLMVEIKQCARNRSCDERQADNHPAKGKRFPRLPQDNFSGFFFVLL